MSLKGIAKQTVAIAQSGKLPKKDGSFIDFSTQQRQAENNTELFTPSQLQSLLPDALPKTPKAKPVEDVTASSMLIEVSSESTQQAAYRLVVEEGVQDVLLLNFASARNAGGGFLNGAKAQEEDICRCSGLYLCQLTQPDFYKINRQQSSLLYTHHLIYSPSVPFFRLKNRELLDDFYMASVITAPAPNAGQYLRRHPDGSAEIKQALYQRAGYVLAAAKARGHKTLILGAWGCGVFGNDPNMVAQAFADWLTDPQFVDAFERIVFAIYTKGESQDTLNAFKAQFLR